MTKNKKSIVNDVHVNAVLSKIFDRIIDNKEITDDDGNTLNDNKRRETINAFKQSIGIH